MKNKVSIIINYFGASWDDWSPFIGKDSKYDSEKFECLDAKEKILAYAESDDVCTTLLKAYYNAANVCEKLANEREKKYEQYVEFHEYGNIITMRLDRFEDGSLSEDLRIIEVNSKEIGYDNSSLFGALAECFYKMLNIVIYQEKSLTLCKSEIIPYKKVKRNDSETMEWKLDTKK